MNNNTNIRTIVISAIVCIIILYVYHECINKPQVEQMDNTEAIENISAIYNSGKMTVVDLEVTGKLTTKDLTATNGATMGNAFVGSNPNDSKMAILSHKDKKTGTTYGIGQSSNGNTTVNSTGADVKIKKDNDVKGGAEIGNAYVGTWNNSDYASVAYKGNNTTTKYSLLQHKDGTSYVNSTNNIYMRKNNSDKKGKVVISTIEPANKDVMWNDECFGTSADAIDAQPGDFVFSSRSVDKMPVITGKLTGNRVGWVGIWGSAAGGEGYSSTWTHTDCKK